MSRVEPSASFKELVVSAQAMKSYVSQIRSAALVNVASLYNLPDIAATIKSASAAFQFAKLDFSFLNIVEGLKAGTKADREVLARLAPRGWLISPWAPGTISQTLLAQLKNGGIEAVEAGLIRELDAVTCSEILNSLFDRPNFARRASVLRKAMTAHRAGDYELAIPIWLLSIDGICQEELGVQKVYSRTQKKPAAKKLATTLTWPVLDGGRDPLGEALIQVIAGFGAPKRKSMPAVLNRHRVLHGEVPEIGTEKDSIQCILVLQVLHFCLGFTEERRETPAAMPPRPAKNQTTA